MPDISSHRTSVRTGCNNEGNDHRATQLGVNTDAVRLRSVALVALLVLLPACRSDDAPQHAYTGRLHVAYANDLWRVEPAPAGTRAVQSREEAKRRAHAPAAELGGSAVRVYFGLFSGVDADGGAHENTPAWFVVATHVKVGDGYQYGVIAFSDDLTQPWVSTKLTTAAKPAVY
jgi:hypothetical protein